MRSSLDCKVTLEQQVTLCQQVTLDYSYEFISVNESKTWIKGSTLDFWSPWNSKSPYVSKSTFFITPYFDCKSSWNCKSTYFSKFQNVGKILLFSSTCSGDTRSPKISKVVIEICKLLSTICYLKLQSAKSNKVLSSIRHMQYAIIDLQSVISNHLQSEIYNLQFVICKLKTESETESAICQLQSVNSIIQTVIWNMITENCTAICNIKSANWNL